VCQSLDYTTASLQRANAHMFNVHPSPTWPACRVYRMPSLPCAAATAQRADLRCAGSLCALRRRGSRTHSAGVHAALGACLPPSRFAVPTPHRAVPALAAASLAYPHSLVAPPLPLCNPRTSLSLVLTHSLHRHPLACLPQRGPQLHVLRPQPRR
jgi:hypothetical protein